MKITLDIDNPTPEELASVMEFLPGKPTVKILKGNEVLIDVELPKYTGETFEESFAGFWRSFKRDIPLSALGKIVPYRGNEALD
jgi:hypothetical protein